jgi:hypothetical protein
MAHDYADDCCRGLAEDFEKDVYFERKTSHSKIVKNVNIKIKKILMNMLMTDD